MKICSSFISFFLFSLISISALSQEKPSFTPNSKGFIPLKNAGHEAISVCYSKDGRYLVSGGNDSKVILWDAHRNDKIVELQGHESIVLATAFSPDGIYFATGSLDQTVIAWTTGGVLDKRFIGHSGAVTSLAFSADGKYLVSGSVDKTVAVWDMNRNMKVKEFRDHKKEVSTVAVSPNGRYLASGSFDGEVLIRLFSNTWEPVDTVKMRGGKIISISFSPDNKHIAIAYEDKTVKIIEFGIKKKAPVFILQGHKKMVNDVKYSPDGKYVAGGSRLDNTVRIWSTETGEKVKELSPFYNFISLAFNPNGQYLATADMDKDIKLWDISSLKIEAAKEQLVVKTTQLLASRTTDATPVSKPEIDIVQPQMQKGKVFLSLEKQITIKGSIRSQAGIYELLIDNKEVPIVGDNDFNFPVKLAYGDNIITLRAIDKLNNVTETSITIQRQVKHEVNDTVARFGTDYALIITTDEYENFHKLSNPINDGFTIGKELKENFNFKVETINNPKRAELYAAIRNYSKKQFNDDDQLFIFIAGHGEFDPVFSEGYIVTTDSRANDEVKESFISHSNLRTIINNIPCKHILLVMDVCFGGTFDQFVAKGRGAAADDVNKIAFIQKKLQYTTRKYLTSGGKEYVPDGRPGAHSPFARKLLDALRSYGGEDKILTFGELYSYSEKSVPGPKTGEFGDNKPGSDFLFLAK
ncbi:MAG: caspase family protein [Cytophagales bacterium]